MGIETNDDNERLDSGPRWRFDRREIAGSLGDLGTLLPLSFGLILVCGLDAVAVFGLAGATYVLTGLYFRTTVPVQPMKAIGAYAIAQGMSPLEIHTAGACMGFLMLFLALTGLMDWVGRIVPQAVVRGVQLSVGVLLLGKGIAFMAGETTLQEIHGAAEPFLTVQALGPVAIGWVLGPAAFLVILALKGNRALPAALVVVIGGVIAGLLLGGAAGLATLDVGPAAPRPLAHGLPDLSTLAVAVVALALPQLPMTIGNAVVSQADLHQRYFGERGRRGTVRAWAMSIGLTNLVAAVLGGMPMCHGAGGLAAHVRFGASTAVANLAIGGALVVAALALGNGLPGVLALLPMAVMGAMLVAAGAELALSVRDVTDRTDLFVCLVMLGVGLALNLAVAFGVGLLLVLVFRTTRTQW